MNRRLLMATAPLLIGLSSLAAAEQAAKPEESKPPQILLGVPLGLASGETNEVLLRGLNLDTVKVISTMPTDRQVRAGLRSQGKSDPPKDETKEAAGDSHLSFEVYLPPDFTGTELTLQATDDRGNSAKWVVPVFDGNVLLLEREDNNQLNHAKKIPTEAVVLGCIQSPKDVDVYEFYAVPGRALLLEVRAGRHGSPLDPALMLYDAAGNMLRADDDSGKRREVRMEWTPLTGGFYRAAVLDASDKGGALHAYLFVIQPAQEAHP